jgi:hypothetical protein
MKYDYLSSVPTELGYPLPSHPLRFFYISRPELLETPNMKLKEKEDKMLSQFIIDQSLYPTVRTTTNESPIGILKIQPPKEDEMTKGLRMLKEKGTSSVWLVFACRIFLDIDILDEGIKRPYQELQKTARDIKARIDSTRVFRKNEGLRWLPKDSSSVGIVYGVSLAYVLQNPMSFVKKSQLEGLALLKKQTTDSASINNAISESASKIEDNLNGTISSTYLNENVHISKNVQMRGVKFPTEPKLSSSAMVLTKVPDIVPEDWDGNYNSLDPKIRQQVESELRADAGLDSEPPTKEHIENHRRLNIQLIQPHDDLEFVFTHNPVYCGIMEFGLRVGMEKVGISFSNYHTLVTLVAHLYNTVRFAGLLDNAKWTDMDQVINMHVSEVFAGRIPQSIEEAYIRYAKCIGLSVGSSIDREHLWYGSGFKWTAGEERGPPYTLPPVTDVFRPLFDHKDTFESSLTKLEPLLQSTQHLDTKHKRRNARQKLTPLQYLRNLQDYQPAQVARLRIDYITLTQRCHMLLKQIRLEIRKELHVEHPMLEHGDSCQPMY